MPSPTEITVAQLSRLIGTPSAPVVIDVRTEEDFDADPRLIPTALRHGHQSISALAPSLLGSKIVVSCHKGAKLSHGSSAMLRAHGIAAEVLEGGHLAWCDAGEPLVPSAKIPKSSDRAATLWVTRHRPKIDRIACPWLIRRFIDPAASSLFVPPAEVLAVADRFGATPFDIDGVFWSHRGDRCTFDTMIEEFGLRTKPLERLATIIRGADTNRHDLAPQAAGLLALSVGLSRMYRDDLEQLGAGMPLYDALYRWCR
jgi:rhodanese-related sulfurtransferase